MDQQEGGTCGARVAVQEGPRASMRRCSASSSVLRCQPGGGSGQGHALTLGHCAHMFLPAGTVEDTVSYAPQRWQVCWRWEAGTGRRPMDSEVVPLLAERAPELQQAGADAAPLVSA